MSHRFLFALAIGGEVPEVRNVSDETALAFAIDHRIAHRDGTLRHVHQQVEVIERDAAGRALRLAGAVVLDATITEDGRVRDLSVVRGNRTLALAAIDAVSQWRYQPTLLNGKPVEVVTTVTVNFRLDQ